MPHIVSVAGHQNAAMLLSLLAIMASSQTLHTRMPGIIVAHHSTVRLCFAASQQLQKIYNDALMFVQKI